MARASELWPAWQQFGAQGKKGAEALMAEVDRLVREGGITSPITTHRGLNARLRYLSSPAGKKALQEHGVSPRLLRSWKAGRHPSAAKRDAVEKAYQERRRANLIRSGALVRLLNNDGQGRRIEIYPVDQSHVLGGYSAGPGTGGRARHNVDQVRSIQGRYIWDDVVAAYADGDVDAMDDIWLDVIQDLDSMYAAYAYVSSISIGA
ncbi:hypothetical protein [Streptomyces fuscigenes]|uniref:hypothetical protein n=1 Tax=Streptomyces fuscigenes TaxID=1528880 RepID=UPI003558AF95